METVANGGRNQQQHRVLDDSDDSDSRPPTGAGGTYEDDFERGLECDASSTTVYDDDDRDEDDRGLQSENGRFIISGRRSYVLDPTAYGDSDEDLTRELTLGLGRRIHRNGRETARPNYELFDRDFASNGQSRRDGGGDVVWGFMKFFRRNRLDARTTSEPSLAHAKDNFYDAPDEVGYDSTPDSGVHESLQNMDPEQRAKQEEEWRNELFVIEDEIQTLRSVLSAKVLRTQDLKKKLGITVWREFREDMEQGLKNVKDSDARIMQYNVIMTLLDAYFGSKHGGSDGRRRDTCMESGLKAAANLERFSSVFEQLWYKSMNDKLGEFHQALASAPLFQKTETVLKTAGEKTTTVLGSLGASVSRKIGEVKNSPTFRSFEERVGSAYTNVKTRVSSRSSSMQNFDDLSEGQHSTGATPVTTPSIPEDKPLL